MPDFPIIKNINPIVFSPAIPQSLGEALNGMGFAISSSTFPTANKALYVPFSVSAPVTIVKMFVINGTVVSGNIDVGIYDRGGARLVSSGSTAQAGTSAIQEFNTTDITLNPGLYFLACAMDNTTGTLEFWGSNSAIGRAMGVMEQTTAFVLPATATFALLSSSRVPPVFATSRAVV